MEKENQENQENQENHVGQENHAGQENHVGQESKKIKSFCFFCKFALIISHLKRAFKWDFYKNITGFRVIFLTIGTKK